MWLDADFRRWQKSEQLVLAVCWGVSWCEKNG